MGSTEHLEGDLGLIPTRSAHDQAAAADEAIAVTSFHGQ
jgi:hypothetical protein